MKQYDFVFVYEIKNRELENDCLICYELERRGYKVGFIETWDEEFRRSRPLKTKVVIAFAMYDDAMFRFIDYHVTDCDKYVNMQCEQIFDNSAAEKDLEYVLKLNGSKVIGVSGLPTNAVHISWGENNYKRLVNQFQVPNKNVRITGHVALDFLRPELRKFFLSREVLFQKFHIPLDKKVCLFISSFVYI